MVLDLRSPIDPDDIPAEWWIERMRKRRDALLIRSDWTQIPDVPVDQTAWAEYRQQLRDAPEHFTPGPEWDAPDPPA